MALNADLEFGPVLLSPCPRKREIGAAADAATGCEYRPENGPAIAMDSDRGSDCEEEI